MSGRRVVDGPRPPLAVASSLRPRRYTAKGDTVYAHFLAWPASPTVTLGSPRVAGNSSALAAQLLGWAGSVETRAVGGRVQLVLPPLSPADSLARAQGWVFAFGGVQ